MTAAIEIFRAGKWVKAASLTELGPDRCIFDYLPEYVFSEDPVPIALAQPVEFSVLTHIQGVGGVPEEPDHSVPAFLYDLVPQGKGRKFLLGLLKKADSEQLIVPLLLAGAFNPIGNLRIDTALDFFKEQSPKTDSAQTAEGFELQDIIRKSDGFLQHLALHAMLASGTTGVQGVAPKYLLTQDKEGRWFADMALPDDRAHKHWLLKLPRGRSDEDRMVLRNEAAYLDVARRCGLRVEEEPMLQGDMLFVRRFDRCVTDDGLARLHQESAASLAGMQGFGLKTSQNELLGAIRAYVSNPFGETIEFLKRDALNLALRNTDNHARNTAVQTLTDGTVRLTPLFDFAPMFADPEIVPRTVEWKLADGTQTRDWSRIIDVLDVGDDERAALASELRTFADVVGNLPNLCRDCGVEDRVLEQCRGTIDEVATSLARLPFDQESSALRMVQR